MQITDVQVTQIIRIAIPIAMLFTCVLSYVVIKQALIRLYGKSCDAFEKADKQYKDQSVMTMGYKQLQLSKTGIMFRLKNYELTPNYFEVLKITIGLGFSVLGYLIMDKIIIFPVGFVIGYFGTILYFKYENKKDDQEMMTDIYNTYANIKTQMTAGIYIREVLEYTYSMVKTPRYKEALAELILNFSNKTVSTTSAIYIFKNRFSSRQIDKLSSLLGSFMQYGLNAEHADDIMSEIQGLMQAETLKKENDIESAASGINFAFFFVIIVMIVYMIMRSFSSGGLF